MIPYVTKNMMTSAIDLSLRLVSYLPTSTFFTFLFRFALSSYDFSSCTESGVLASFSPDPEEGWEFW